MRTLCLALVVAVGLSGCSMFSTQSRTDREYSRYLKKAKAQRQDRHKELIKRQRAEQPSLRDSPPPLQQQSVQPAPDDQ
jgi:hypothetical protein